jgi:NTE family protein
MGNVDLVLEGGGVKGIGLVGAIAALESAGYALGDAGRVAGTSAGAVVGALLAAGARADELEKTMRAVDYRRFRDAGPLGVVGSALSLVTRLGLYKGDWLHGWIADQLAARGVRTFADLRFNDPDSALPDEQSYRLVVVVSDVSRGRMLRLPWDYAHYGLDADEQPVADAVRASASIPFFFRPRWLADTRGGADSCLVDGGMLSNFPIHLFDRDDDREPRWPTLGVKLSARPPQVEGPNGEPAVRGLLGLTRALVSTMVESHDRMHLSDPKVIDRTVFVDTDGVNGTDFDLGDATRDRLFDAGVAAGEQFLATWDFQAYLSRYRPEWTLREAA